MFAGVAIAQLAFITFVGLQFRSQDKILQTVMADAVKQREQAAAAMAPFSMDPLLGMCTGARTLSQQELVDLRLRAQRGQAKLHELESTQNRWIELTAARLGAVSQTAARDFRKGVADAQAESDEIMKLSQDFFIQSEHLASFLNDHQLRYQPTSAGPVFDKPEDQQVFNHQVDAIAGLQEQLQAHVQQAQRRFQDLPH